MVFVAVDIFLDASFTGSQFLYKLKVDNSSKLFKDRLSFHGIRDKKKGRMGKQCANASFMVIRLLLSLTSTMRFQLASADVLEAYFQIKPIDQNLYVPPPPEKRFQRGVI